MAKVVTYVSDKGEVNGVIQPSDYESGNVDIWVPDKDTGAGGIVKDVPHRSPKDYGPEGGGHTYH